MEITKFPAVSRDVALLLKAEVTHQEVVDAIQAAGVKRLTDIKLFDVFSGEKLGLGMKSMAYSLTFQNPEDSLTDEESHATWKKSKRLSKKKSMQKCVKR
ncbi:phenylalanyl-tRNA synthetase, beta chain [Streptococcus pneumoniae]|nr:phenylalanyl-tRNA synthetase, beta chain [Streptococcus pneumoniae]